MSPKSVKDKAYCFSTDSQSVSLGYFIESVILILPETLPFRFWLINPVTESVFVDTSLRVTSLGD